MRVERGPIEGVAEAAMEKEVTELESAVAEDAIVENATTEENVREGMASGDAIIEEKEEITIEKPIYKDGENIQRVIDERGQYAKTVAKVIKRFHEKNVTLVECELFTGRTHQIRVHLKSIGYPIVGDELYGHGIDEKKGIKRQFLHAYRVKFTQPSKNEEVEIEIPIFKDMEEFLKRK